MASISEAIAAALNKRNGSNENGGNRNVAKGLAKLLAGGALVAGGARIGAPAMRGLVRVGERTANGRFLNSTRLGRFLKPFTRTALYGDDVARTARKGGVAHMFQGQVLNDNALKLDQMFDTMFSDYKVNKFMEKHLGKDRFIKRMMKGMQPGDKARLAKEISLSPTTKDTVKFYGFMPKPKGANGVGSVASEAERLFADNKVNQAELFKRLGLEGMMPQSIGHDVLESSVRKAVSENPDLLKTIRRKGGVGADELRDIVKKYTGKDIFIKKLEDTAGATDSARHLFDAEVGKDGLLNLSRKDLGDYMFQEAKPTKQFTGLGRKMQFTDEERKALLKDYIKSHPGRKTTRGITDADLERQYLKKHPLKRMYEGLRKDVFGDLYQNPPRQHEYRVHAVNGKVVPFATSEKWDPIGYFNPFESRRKRKIEQAFQELLDRAEKSNDPFVKKFNLKNQVFGADVGIGPNGEPIFYELNPTMSSSEHYGSGQLNFPWIRHAITRAIQGRMSRMQKLQLMAGAAPVAAGTGMTASGAGNMRDRRR